MKNRTLAPLGSLHPILFFAFVYVVALLFSIFICSSLFYSCNASPANGLTEEAVPSPQTTPDATAVVLQK